MQIQNDKIISGVVGTATNDNAAAGNIGEFVTATSGWTGLTAGAASDLTSISLTAGDWEVMGSVVFTGDTSTVVQQLIGWASSTSATLASDEDRNTMGYSSTGLTVFTGGNVAFNIPTLRFSLPSTTTVYLSVYTNFSVSTLNSLGKISARRMR